MVVALACDHGAYDLKEALKRHLEEKGITCRDFGCYNKESCDYTDFAAPAAPGGGRPGNATGGLSAAPPASASPLRPIRSEGSAVRWFLIP